MPDSEECHGSLHALCNLGCPRLALDENLGKKKNTVSGTETVIMQHGNQDGIAIDPGARAALRFREGQVKSTHGTMPGKFPSN